jgi:hypothetical protein
MWRRDMGETECPLCERVIDIDEWRDRGLAVFVGSSETGRLKLICTCEHIFEIDNADLRG